MGMMCRARAQVMGMIRLWAQVMGMYGLRLWVCMGSGYGYDVQGMGSGYGYDVQGMDSAYGYDVQFILLYFLSIKQFFLEDLLYAYYSFMLTLTTRYTINDNKKEARFFCFDEGKKSKH